MEFQYSLIPISQYGPLYVLKDNWLYFSYSIVFLGDLHLSGSIIRKSRFILTKERRTIMQKSGCLNHLNELILQVNIQMQGGSKISGKGVHIF